MAKLLDADRIEGAIEQSIPFFQPIVSLRDETHYGFEALGRLQLDGEVIYPGQFLPFIEGTPLMSKFDSAIAARTIPEVGAMHQRGELARVHVNADIRTLAMREYVHLLQEMVAAHNVDPRMITIEVVEPESFWENSAIVENIRLLTQTGFTIAIDDFPNWDDPRGLMTWAESSTLVKTLKIDKSFFYKACDDGDGTAMMELIRYVRFAHENKMEVVVEGIENANHAAVAQWLEIDFLQGYWMGKPKPIEQWTYATRPSLHNQLITGMNIPQSPPLF